MSKSKDGKETPLMKQYNAIKAKHPGALLLFRVGDFYETFGEDAIIASKVLDIVLTKRANGAASHIELAGFPHHSLDNYLPKLVRAGNRVAICDQLEDPKSVKGIVKRGVTELVTPGLSYNDQVLDTRKNNYLASIHFGKDKHGIAFLDVSTGEFMCAEGNSSYVEKLLQSFAPAEIIFSKAAKKTAHDLIKNDYITFHCEDWVYQFDYTYEKLKTHFETANLKGFGIEELEMGIVAAGAILFYLEETEHKEIQHISAISRIAEEKYVWLDKFTIRNLELVFPQHDGGVPLIQILDHTVTPMGSRMMKKWMVLPLKEKAPIEERLNVVEFFHENAILIDEILAHLRHIGDLERLISKVVVGRANPREMNQIRRALKAILPVKTLLKEQQNPTLKRLADQIHPCEYILEKIEKELQEDAPMLVHQGGVIKDGVDAELDEYRNLANKGKDFLVQIQQREIQNTGISSLKIAFNKVFGYYLEVTHAHKDKVPQEWIRKQTLVNAERYITPELKEYEEKILNAEDRMIALEQKYFQELVTETAQFVTQIQQNARIVGTLDALLSFAQVALNNNYSRPKVSDTETLEIKDGRHPVIEKQLPAGEEYIPNDIYLDHDSQQIIIITGPNMAGKSALLRQTALIVLMAQMGSFVPASFARVGIIDKVFTRVGASDNLSKGESTFMVEMTETASILNNLSDRSLVLMDEIGRGTSTYDGISIAWSIVEYLHNHPTFKAKTLFATHYHELNQLTQDFPRIKNFNVAVKEVGNKVIFMRKLKEGGSEHSFGIHVAQMAGMPNPVVLRAAEIMSHLEKDKAMNQGKKSLSSVPKNNYQLSMFEMDPKFKEAKELLDQIDINSISPIEALLKLHEVKKTLD
ncbi:MAG TPA: DNA mismatch repair protein MutS [Algoriphagus sp.]|jgi:DNA mismatch repair protein MutS|uniref:DNA mismatch repair protein MutS n=2 Tax=Cyclobacteriaceae TaxID=563798 RepID=UPI000C605F72|nr:MULTISPECIES: DNA mismatch repair protein MutS [Algoriphagus]MAL12129.1 DNA mismatch repair protein MutS [Algoriphagus sp.]MAN87021.1 DNA mismatch repair protein MutS [Algoriphagus sp.]HCB47099.1 DNA mismatch repair protein MutS [Algoriphagus sp.]HCD86689.1 DNA mismatch repair protein MutS [Algoriphagus sp.]